MRVNVRRWEMHRDGEGIAVVPSCSLNTFPSFWRLRLPLPLGLRLLQ